VRDAFALYRGGAPAFGEHSETYMLVHVERIENGDAGPVSLDPRTTVPTHLCQGMVSFQDGERVSNVGKKRDGLDRLQAIGTDMEEPLERHPIERCPQSFLAGVGRAIKLHRHDLLASIGMWLDLVAVRISIDHRFSDQLQIGGAGKRVAARTNFEPVTQSVSDRLFDLFGSQHSRHCSPGGSQCRLYLVDILAIEPQRHTGFGTSDRVISLGGNMPNQILVEIQGKEISEHNMRERNREMIRSFDA